MTEPVAGPGAALCAGLLSSEILLEIARIQPDAADLFAEEARLVEKAIPKRRHEFAAGRRCARALLARLGQPHEPLLRDADRAPIWPREIVGSISHAGDRVAVAIALRAHCAGLGIDLESDQPLERALWPKICTAREIERAVRERRMPVGVAVRVAFSAKEAVYKCVHPHARRFIGFGEVEIDARPDGSFHTELPDDVRRALPSGAELDGRYRLDEGWILTALTLRSPS